MALITVDQAKAEERITHDDLDDVLEEKVNEASHIVLDYLKREETEWQTTAGEPDDVPYLVQAATKIVVHNLIEGIEPLSQAVKDLLRRYRDPAIA